MLIYALGIFITLCLSYFIYPSWKPNYYNKFFKLNLSHGTEQVLKILCIFPLFFLSAFRYGVGTDFFLTYYYGFQRILIGSDIDHFETGYKIFIILISKVSTDPQILFIASSLIFVCCVWIAIYQQSVDITFSILLVIITRYYFISLNGIRQFMALAIILYSMKYLIQGRKGKVKYLLFNILALLIHKSVAICLILLVLDRINFSKIKSVFVCIIFGIVWYLSKIGFLFNFLSGLFSDDEKFSGHLNTIEYLSGNKFIFVTLSFNILILVIMLLAGNYQNKINNKLYRLYFNIQVITVIICICLSTIPLMERIYWNFGFFQIISIPYMISMYPNKKTRIILKVLIICLLTIYCIYDIFVMQDHQVVPYRFCF